MVRVTQGAFNAGILSDGMYARADTEKFQKGLKDALNVLVKPQGGVANRAGTAGVTRHDTSYDGVPQRLVPFAFSTEQTYQLEFSKDVFRVIRNGAYVLDTAVGEKAVSSVTMALAAEIVLGSAGDAASFPAGCLAYLTDPNGDHRLHEAIIRITGASGANLTFTAFNGAALDTGSPGWGAIGAGATLQKVYEKEHPYALADMPRVRYAQDADTMFLVHPSYPPHRIGRLDHDDWISEPVDFGADVGAVPEVTKAITGATKANPVVLTVNGHGLSVGDAFSVSGVGGMTQLNDTLFVAASVTTNTITLNSRTGAPIDGSAYGTYTSGGTLTSPGAAAVFGVDVDMGNLVDYGYAVSAIAEDTFEEGLPTATFRIENDLFFKGSINYLGWAAVPGASRYAVYKTSAGALGYIGTTTETTFTDENITPDTATGVRLDRNPFAGPGDYPSVVAFYEQRLAFGATDNDPQLVEMSRVDNIKSFNNSYPSLPDDAFRFRLRDTRVNRIRAMVPADSFMLLTSGGEWEIAPQGDGEYIRPDKRKLAPQTYYGSADMEPLYTGSVVLYVEPSRRAVRDYRPNDKSTPPGDLTVLAGSLFEDRTITSWAYAAAPDKVVWVTQDDGALLSMTYMPEHDVWAWTRHELGGTNARARQVSVNREGVRDVLYVVVTREIDGVDVTMTERLEEREDTTVERCYFVDGGLRATYDSPVAEVTGLLHLRGEEVVALVDGDVVTGLEVDDTGTVDLRGTSGRHISVGLPYDALIQTLGVRMEIDGLGSSEGRYKATSEIAVRLKRSRGVEVGVTLSRMQAPKEWTAALVGQPIPLQTHTLLYTVSGDWMRDATTYIRQRNPLPMTVLGVSPEWEIGE